MKKRAIALAAAALFAAVVVCHAGTGDAFLGTWKLNEAKSKITAGMPRNSVVIYAAAGDSIKVTVVEGTSAEGKPVHTEWTGKYDGKDYVVTGDSGADTRAYRVVSAHILAVTTKKGGKIINTSRIVVSADGKTRTVTTTPLDATASGKTSSSSVYNRQ